MLGRLVLIGAGAAAGAVATWKLAVEPWYHEWGVVEGDADRTLPGDDIVPEATVSDTRSIEIAAPPEAVWPWLAQMGFGRGGWYSYDQMDMAGNSIRHLEPDWQSLKVGDVVPTHAYGGFLVKSIDPGHALVLYLDGAMVAEQAKAAQAKATQAARADKDAAAGVTKAVETATEAVEGATEAVKAAMAPDAPPATPANLRATGAVLSTGLPTEFEASWTFALEPLPGDRTRLVERFRVRVGDGQPMSRVAGPFMGFGIFLMTRKQMLGIRERAEAGAPVGVPVMAGRTEGSEAIPPTPEPSPA
jgi:hypothetical protein